MPEAKFDVAVLDNVGLWKPLLRFSGLPALVVVCVGIAQGALWLFGLDSAGIPKEFVEAIVLVAGTITAIIGYSLGDVWDTFVFDPLYRIGGRWATRKNRPLGLLPEGHAMNEKRQAAAHILVPASSDGSGVYRAAVARLRDETTRWDRVEAPQTISKFVRSFIWPALLASLVCLVRGLVWVKSNGAVDLPSLGFASTFAVVFVLLFVPYLKFRVEHLYRLYDEAAEVSSPLIFSMIRLLPHDTSTADRAWTVMDDHTFVRNYEVGADPVFDLAVGNRCGRPFLIRRVGVRMVRRDPMTGGIFGGSVPLEVQADLKVACPREWKGRFGAIDESKWTELSRPREMVDDASKFTFTLQLENFCDASSASKSEIRFLVDSDRGVGESESYWLRQ